MKSLKEKVKDVAITADNKIEESNLRKGSRDITSVSARQANHEEKKEEIVAGICCDVARANPEYVTRLIAFLTGEMRFRIEAETVLARVAHSLAEKNILIDELELLKVSLEHDLDSVTKNDITVIRLGNQIDVRGQMNDKTIPPNATSTIEDVYFNSSWDDFNTRQFEMDQANKKAIAVGNKMRQVGKITGNTNTSPSFHDGS